MFKFYQLFFNNYSTPTEQENLWYDIVKDFIWPALLAILAVWWAYKIFKAETKRDDTKEIKRKQDENEERMFFFSEMLANIIKVSNQQCGYIKEYIEKINLNAVTFSIPKQVPLEDLKRVSTTIEVEKYLLAYVHTLKGERMTLVKEFSEILHTVDFLYESFKGHPQQVQLSSDFYHKRLEKLQSMEAQIRSNIDTLFLHEGGFHNLAWHDKLLSIVEHFQSIIRNRNHEPFLYDEHWFKPLLNYCIEYKEAVGNLPNELKTILPLVRDARGVYKYLKRENQLLAEGLQAEYDALTNAATGLANASRRLSVAFEVPR